MRMRGLRSHADLCRALQGVVTLLQHPEQLDELKNDPSLAKGTVEELLRYHTASALAMRRVALQDVPLAGKVWCPLNQRPGNR